MGHAEEFIEVARVCPDGGDQESVDNGVPIQ
jgi:hypothetical protein